MANRMSSKPAVDAIDWMESSSEDDASSKGMSGMMMPEQPGEGRGDKGEERRHNKTRRGVYVY